MTKSFVCLQVKHLHFLSPKLCDFGTGLEVFSKKAIIFNLVISLVPYVEGGTWRRSKFQGSNFKVDQQHFCKMTHVAKLFQNRYIYSMKRVPKINWPFEKKYLHMYNVYFWKLCSYRLPNIRYWKIELDNDTYCPLSSSRLLFHFQFHEKSMFWFFTLTMMS